VAPIRKNAAKAPFTTKETFFSPRAHFLCSYFTVELFACRSGAGQKIYLRLRLCCELFDFLFAVLGKS